MRPPIPTPEPIREAMKAAGWILALDLLDGRKYCEVWVYPHRDVMKTAEIDLATWRTPQVRGDWENITAGFGILSGE